ncbi:MAG: signal peptidase II [Clostridiales bacterium]|nr:signal peptidase II [Clostridiales bacterium]
MFYLPLIGAIAAGDQVCKARIERQDPEDFPRPLAHTKGRIWLYRSHNEGFPFGFLSRYQELVRMVPLAVTSALGGVLACLLSRPGEGLRKLGLSFLIGGSASNLYDRLARRYVIDYFSIRVGKLGKAVLNLGDVFVFLGAATLFLAEIREEHRGR